MSQRMSAAEPLQDWSTAGRPIQHPPQSATVTSQSGGGRMTSAEEMPPPDLPVSKGKTPAKGGSKAKKSAPLTKEQLEEKKSPLTEKEKEAVARAIKKEKVTPEKAEGQVETVSLTDTQRSNILKKYMLKMPTEMELEMDVSGEQVLYSIN